MSTENATGQEPAGTTDESTTTIAADASELPVFGVDAEGRLHRYSRAAETVVVTDDEHTVLREQPDVSRDRVVAEWVPFVGHDCGWVDHWFDARDFADVAGRLGRALTAAEVSNSD